MSSEIITQQDTKLIAETICGPEATVLSFDLKPYSEDPLGLMSAHRRLRIQVRSKNKKDQTTEISCFVKALPLDCAPQLDYIKESTVFEKETAFYSKIAPVLLDSYSGPAWCPRCYIARDGMLCFEDLSVQGFGMRGKLFNGVSVKSAIRAIASFHASSICAEVRLGRSVTEVQPDFFYELLFVKNKKIHEWFKSGVQVAVAVAERMGLDSSRLPEAFEIAYKAVGPSKTKVNVINHGDLWANNMLFDDQDNCRLVDFQLFRYCPPGLDLAVLLYLCAPSVLRRTKEKELLRYYYDHLVEYVGGERSRLPSFEEICQGYEERKIVGCITAVLYFPQALMNLTTTRDLLTSFETFDDYVIGDRRDIVLESMQKDRPYGERVEDVVKEFVEMSFKLDQIPQPC
uniref:CHK kinase-like domain-containing protein n=1 Tax=Bracon brevicornis TaxID=1563983 RepID=A0A6V7J1J5_9HYME